MRVVSYTIRSGDKKLKSGLHLPVTSIKHAKRWMGDMSWTYRVQGLEDVVISFVTQDTFYEFVSTDFCETWTRSKYKKVDLSNDRSS